uniref:Protein NRDE2 homolog n=1 Tax=Rhabditophanes sp. KR3021 TaxID=114890 RepID=A0AC35U111_9BILA
MSLFPQYAEDSKKDKACSSNKQDLAKKFPFFGKKDLTNKFPFFAKKEPELITLSDDDGNLSDKGGNMAAVSKLLDQDSERKARKKREKKEKKKLEQSKRRKGRKRTYSSSSAEEVVVKKDEKWCFLRRCEIKEANVSFFVKDTRPDKSNFQYNGMNARYVPLVYKKTFNICGLRNFQLTQNYLTPVTSKNDYRYYTASRTKSKQDEKVEKMVRRKKIDTLTSFVPLSLKDEEYMESEDCQTIAQTINQKLSKNPNDIEGWLEFIKIQKDLLNENGKAVSQTVIEERTLAIIDRALRLNGSSIALKKEKLMHLYKMGNMDVFLKQWNMILIQHMNSLELWSSFFEIILHDMRSFRTTYCMQLMDYCFEKLYNIHKKITLTHQAEAGTLNFLANLLYKRVALLFQTDRTECGVAIIQAFIEFHYFMPDSLKLYPMAVRKKEFEKYWSNNNPKIGISNGWKHSLSVDQSSLNLTDYYQLEDQLCHQLVDLDVPESWVQIEKFRQKLNWLPIATNQHSIDDDNFDTDRRVSFDDVKCVLFEFDETKDTVLFKLLKLLSIDACTKADEDFECLPDILKSFEVFPAFEEETLHGSLPFVDKLLQTLIEETTGELKQKLIVAKIVTSIKLIKKDKNYESCANDIAKHILKQMLAQPLYNTPINACIMAEELFKLGIVKIALKLARSYLDTIKCNLFEISDRKERNAYIRISMNVINWSEDKSNLMAYLALKGNLYEFKPSSSVDLINGRRKWMSIAKRLDECVENWIGNEFSMLTSLNMQYIYLVGRRINDIDDYIDRIKSTIPKERSRALELIYERQLKLHKLFLKENPHKSPITYKKLLERVVHEFPDNIGVLKAFVDENISGNSLNMHHTLSALPTSSICKNIASIYGEWKRYENILKVVDVDANFSPDFCQLRRSIEINCEIVVKKTLDASLWRILLLLEHQNGHESNISSVFLKGLDSSVWSKAFLMDYILLHKKDFHNIIQLFFEKEIRVRCLVEEIPLLL